MNSIQDVAKKELEEFEKDLYFLLAKHPHIKRLYAKGPNIIAQHDSGEEIYL